MTTCGSVGVVPVTITSSDPPDGWIDPLSQLDPANPATPRIKQFHIVFSTRVFDWDGAALTPDAFTVTTTDNTDADIPPPPFINVASVTTPDVDNDGVPDDPSKVTVTLDQAIPFGEWTTLEIRVENACGVKETHWIDVAHLPDDVNQDGKVNVQDATAFGNEHDQADPNATLIDINRDSFVDVRDSTEFGNQWRGDPPLATIEWRNKELPSRP